MQIAALAVMAAAAEAMQSAVARIEAQNAELAARVDRIVAEVEDSPQRRRDAEEGQGKRKTIDPVVSVLLAKSGVDVDQKLEAAALDASLATLPVEQRIAVKAQPSM